MIEIKKCAVCLDGCAALRLHKARNADIRADAAGAPRSPVSDADNQDTALRIGLFEPFNHLDQAAFVPVEIRPPLLGNVDPELDHHQAVGKVVPESAKHL